MRNDLYHSPDNTVTEEKYKIYFNRIVDTLGFMSKDPEAKPDTKEKIQKGLKRLEKVHIT